MKRLLILTICISVILCSLPVGAADVADTTVVDNYSDSLKVEYGLLEKLGILNKDIDELDADKTYVTRQEFAQYIANALQIASGSYSGEKFFEDVAQDSVINYLCSLGYIKADKTFDGDRNITNEEATIIAVRALGYESYVNALGGKAFDYIRVAKKIELDVIPYDTNAASYANVIELLYNMVHTKVFDIKGANNDAVVFVQSDKTLLNTAFNIDYTEGVIGANSYLSIYKNIDCCAEGRVVINGKTYILPEAEDFVGQYVRLYYLDDGLNTGVHVHSMYQYEEEYRISSRNVDSASFKLISYYNENGSERSISLNNPLYVYNGAPLFGASVSDINTRVKADRTELRVIKHNKETLNDIVFIDTYINAVISNVDTKNEKLYVESYGVAKDFSYKSGSQLKVIITENGVLKSKDTFQAEQLVSIYESLNKKVIKFDISTTSITGTVKNVRKDSDVTYYTIDDTEYAVDKAATFASVAAGQSRTFKIDNHGLIADVEHKTDGILGYIYGADDEGVFDTDHKFKIFDELGQHKVYSLAKKVELDGVRYPAATVYSALRQSNGSYRQFIIFSYNAKDEITKIDSILNPEGLNRVGKKLEREGIRYNNGFTGYSPAAMDTTKDIYCVSSKTKKFTLPAEGLYADESMFKIESGYKPELDKEYTVELYKTNDETEFVDLIAEYMDSYSTGASIPEENTTPCMVAYIYTLLNNDEIDTIIDGQLQYGTVRVKSVRLTDYVNVKKVNGEVISCAKKDIEQYISEGDVVQFGNADINGKTGSVRILFDYSEEKAYFHFKSDGTYQGYKLEDKSYSELSNGVTRGVYGYVYNFSTDKDNTFSVAPIDSNPNNVVEHETFGGNVLNHKIVVYDSQKNDRYTVKVSLNSIGDIVGYDSSKDGASKVFVYNTNYTAYHPFFYK